MAVIFDNNYYKILGCEEDENGVCRMKIDIYATQSDREKEKRIKEEVINLQAKINDYVINEFERIKIEINKNAISNSFTDIESNPDLFSQVKAYDEMVSESLYLRQCLLCENIDYEALNFKEVWDSLGLTKEMCSKISIVERRGFKVQSGAFENLSDMYGLLKSKFIGSSYDC